MLFLKLVGEVGKSLRDLKNMVPDMRAEFAKCLGLLHIMWSTHQTLLEMIAMRELGISKRHAEILFASLNISAIQEIAQCLLREAEQDNSKLIEAIAKVPEIAKRNHLTHSSVHFSRANETIAFVKRDTKKGFRYKEQEFNQEAFYARIRMLNEAMIEAQDLSGITDGEYMDYSHDARLFLNDLKPGTPSSSNTP